MPGTRPPGVTLSNWDLGGEVSAWAYARDLVIAFTGTPRQDGSDNLLRWYSRRLAVAIGQHPRPRS